MKQPKKLTKKQKQIVSGKYLNPKDWMLVKEEQGYIVIVNKTTKKRRILNK